MEDRNQFAELRRKNLRKWMDDNRVNNTAIAEKLEVGRAYVSTLFSPDRFFGEKAARSIEKKLSLPDMYLDMDQDKPMMVDSWEKPGDLPDDFYALVPRIEVRLAAGTGKVSSEETNLPPLAFRKDWLSKKSVSSKSNLRIVDVSGESMEPYLFDKDVVMLDLGQTDIVDNQVYGIRYGDDLRIKRLSKRFDGGLLVRSDNPRFPEESLSPEQLAHVSVLGRVLWRGG